MLNPSPTAFLRTKRGDGRDPAEDGRRVRLILVSGSTSAGAGDMIYQVLDEIGRAVFHGVNLKPGKPTLFGLIDGKPCLGLPGYPTSALTVFSCLAAPAIRKALGLHQSTRATGKACRTHPGGRPPADAGRGPDWRAGLSCGQGQRIDHHPGGADGVIEIPADVEYLEHGEKVEVELFSELDAPDLVVAGENSMLLERLAETSLAPRTAEHRL